MLLQTLEIEIVKKIVKYYLNKEINYINQCHLLHHFFLIILH